jgi:hypothetical protein
VLYEVVLRRVDRPHRRGRLRAHEHGGQRGGHGHHGELLLHGQLQPEAQRQRQHGLDEAQRRRRPAVVHQHRGDDAEQRGRGAVDEGGLVVGEVEDESAEATGSPETVDVLYYSKLPALVADSDSNWLLLGYPHLYMYGVTAELGIPLQDSSIIQINKALYESALGELKDADLGRRWGGASIVLTSPTP